MTSRLALLAIAALVCASLVGTPSPAAAAGTSDLALAVADSPDPVLVGNEVTYHATITNNGPDPAMNTQLAVALPGGVSLVSATPSGIGSCSGVAPLTCDWAGVGVAASVSVDVVVTMGSVGVTATPLSVASDSVDPDASDDSVTVQTTVVADADLSVAETDSTDPIALGGSTVYEVVVTNLGPGSASGIQLTNTIHPHTEARSWNATADGSCSGPASGTAPKVVCTWTSLAPGASVSALITVGAEGAGNSTNTSTVTSDSPDADQTNNSASQDTTISWTPGVNGRIAYVSDADGDDEIYVMYPDGTNVQQLTDNTANDRQPAWSPDGSKIAFISNRDGNNEVYVMDPDGTDQTNLTWNGANDQQPAWSPDGSRIAFTTSRSMQQLWVMNADGTGAAKKLGWGDVYTDGGNPLSWSPGGGRILWRVSSSMTEKELLSVRDSGGWRRLVPGYWLPSSWAWSPDGTHLAVTWCPAPWPCTTTEDLVVVEDAWVTGASLVSASGGVDWKDPSWSPDGNKIVAAHGTSIVTLDADGSDQGVIASGSDPSWQNAATDSSWPPETTIDSGPSGTVTTTEATFTFSSEAGATFECDLDGGGWADCSSPKAYPELADGSHTFSVRATDQNANTDPTPAVRTWVLDATPPETAIDSGPSGTVTTTEATFTFSSEAGATFECDLDGDGWAGCNGPKSYNDLAYGSHTFSVRATDAAGNPDPTPATRAWTVASAATALSINRPRIVVAGTWVRVTGTLSSPDESCVAGQPVYLKKGESTVGPDLAGAAGGYRFRTKITAKTVVQVSFAGTAGCAASKSVRKTINVT